MWIGWN